MKIEFNDYALEELYVSGTTTNSQYRRLSKDVIRQYIKVVNYLRAVRRIEDLFCIKSLHYEKKKGDLNGLMLFGLTSSTVYCFTVLTTMKV